MTESSADSHAKITPLRVFISYGHDENAELAERLSRDLASRGHETWLDIERLKPGVDWEDHIAGGLDWVAEVPHAGRVILLMTPHAVQRPGGYCLNEIARALSRRLTIIPVMVVWCEPPLSICRVQWLDMTACVPVRDNLDAYEARRDRLFRALEGGDVDFEGDLSSLRYHLEPLEFSADLAQHARTFVGRRCELDLVASWVQKPDAQKILWISGPPGIGKTALATYVCHTMRVGAFHLCRRQHDDKADPRRLVLSIAYQLASQLPGYRKRLLVMNLAEEVRKSAATAFDNLIVQPLSGLESPSEKTLVVIDALDEAQGDKKNELADFLAREFPRTPAWLRLLVTSRPEPDLERHFEAVTRHDLDPASSDNIADLQTFLESNLSAIPGGTSQPAAVQRVASLSEGSFLYADWVLKGLAAGRMTIDRVGEFPEGLGGIYRHFFERQFPDPAEYACRFRPLLEMTAAAHGPLPLRMAAGALGWGAYEIQFAADGRATGEIIERLGSLFVCPDGSLRPFHLSVLDWLTNPAASGTYHSSREEGKKRLAQACWEEFLQERLSPYAAEHLPHHLLEAERMDDLLTAVLSPRIGFLQRWTQGIDAQNGIVCLEKLIEWARGDRERRVISAGLATQLARIHALRGERDVAKRWLEYALENTDWLNGRRVRAIAWHELGSLALDMHDRSAARGAYRRALRLCRWGMTPLRDEAAANLNGLATVDFLQGRLDSARRMAVQGLKEARKAGDLAHVIALDRRLGAILRALGESDEAERRFREALDIAEQHEIPVERGRLALELGWLYFDRAEIDGAPFDEAGKWFVRAAGEARRVHDFQGMLRADINLAMSAIASARIEEVDALIESLKEHDPAQLSPDLAVGVALLSADLAFRRRDFARAEREYRNSIIYCRDHEIGWGQRVALTGLGAILWHIGKHKEAESEWDAARARASRISSYKRKVTEAAILRLKAPLPAG